MINYKEESNFLFPSDTQQDDLTYTNISNFSTLVLKFSEKPRLLTLIFCKSYTLSARQCKAGERETEQISKQIRNGSISRVNRQPNNKGFQPVTLLGSCDVPFARELSHFANFIHKRASLVGHVSCIPLPLPSYFRINSRQPVRRGTYYLKTYL